MTTDDEFKYLPLELLDDIIDRIDDVKSLAVVKNVNRTWHSVVIKNKQFKATLIDYIQALLMKNVGIDFKIEHLQSKNNDYLILVANVIKKKAGQPNLGKIEAVTKNILNKQIIALMMDQYLYQFSGGTINPRLVDRPNSPYFILFGFYLLSTCLHYAVTRSPDRNFLTSFIFTYEVYVALIRGFIKHPFVYAMSLIPISVAFCTAAITVCQNTSLIYKHEIVTEIEAAHDRFPTSQASIAPPTKIMTLAWKKNPPFSLPKNDDHMIIEIGDLNSEASLSTKKNQ